MNVLDRIFDSDDYREMVNPNLAPVVGVVGNGHDETQLKELTKHLSSSSYQASNKLIFTSVPSIDEVEKKKDKGSDHYSHQYQVHGIVKRDWVRRHQTCIFGCVLLLFDWDKAEVKDRLAFEQLIQTKVDKARQRIRGMCTRLLLVLHTTRGPTQSVPPYGSYLGFEDALLNVRSRCGLDDKSIAVQHKEDTKSTHKVHRCAYELCMRYHRDETSRIKKYKSDLSRTSNHSAMTARHRFKVGVHAELAQDAKLKRRNYDKSYAACRAMATSTPQGNNPETRFTATIIMLRNLTSMLQSTTQEAEQLLKQYLEHCKWLEEPFPKGLFETVEEEATSVMMSQWLLTELYTSFAEVMTKALHMEHLRGLSGVTGKRAFAQPGMPGFNIAACADTLAKLRDSRDQQLELVLASPATTKYPEGENLPSVDPPEFMGQEYRGCNSTKLYLRHMLTTPSSTEVSNRSSQMTTRAIGLYREMGLQSRCYSLSLQLVDHMLFVEDFKGAYAEVKKLLFSAVDPNPLYQWPQMATTARKMLVRAVMSGDLYKNISSTTTPGKDQHEELCHCVRTLLLLMANLPALPRSSSATREDTTTRAVEDFSNYVSTIKLLFDFLAEENPDKVIVLDERIGKGTFSASMMSSAAPLTRPEKGWLSNRGIYAPVMTVTCYFDTAYVEAEVPDQPLKFHSHLNSEIPIDGLALSDLTLLFSMDGKDENAADFIVNIPLSAKEGDDAGGRSSTTTISRDNPLSFSGELFPKKAGLLECVGAMGTLYDTTLFFKVDTLPARRKLLDSRGQPDEAGRFLPAHQGGAATAGIYDHTSDRNALASGVYFPHRPAVLIVPPVPKVQLTQLSGTTAKQHAMQGEDYSVEVQVKSLGDRILPGSKLLVGCYTGVVELVSGEVFSPSTKNDSPGKASSSSGKVGDSRSRSQGAVVQEEQPDGGSETFTEEPYFVTLENGIEPGESTQLNLVLRCVRAGKLQINISLQFETNSRQPSSSRDQSSPLKLSCHSKLAVHVCHPVFVYFTVADTTIWDVKKSAASGNTLLSDPTASAVAGTSADGQQATVNLGYDGTSGFFVESPEMRTDHSSSIAVNPSTIMAVPSLFSDLDTIHLLGGEGLETESSYGGSFAGSATAAGLGTTPPAGPSSGFPVQRSRGESQAGNRDSHTLGSLQGFGLPPTMTSGGGGAAHHSQQHPLQFYTAQQSQLPTETMRMSMPLSLRSGVPFMVSCRFVNSMQFPLTLHRMFIGVEDLNRTRVLSEQEPPGLLPCTIGVDEEYTFTAMLEHDGEGKDIHLGAAVLELSRGFEENDSRLGNNSDNKMDDIFGSPDAKAPPTGGGGGEVSPGVTQRLEHTIPLPVANFTNTPVIVSFEYPQEVQVNKTFPLICKVKNMSDKLQEVEIMLAPGVPGHGAGGGGGQEGSSSSQQQFLVGGRTSWNVTLPPSREKTTTFKMFPTTTGFLSLPSFMGQCQGSNIFVLWPDERRTVSVVPKPNEEFLA